MIKTSSRQTGSIFVVIIIVLVAAIIAGLGFILWNNLQSEVTSKQATNTTKSATNVSSKPIVATPRYLVLSDWSVKFTLPTNLDLSDVYYYKTHVAEGSEYFGFTTNRVRAQGDACDNQVTGNLVTLTRSATKGGSGTLINSTAIGGYFYFSGSSVGDITPTPACLLTSIAVQDRALLDELVKSIMTQ